MIIVDITTEVVPADDLSQTNTEQFIVKLVDSAKKTFSDSVRARFIVDLPSFVSKFELIR